MRRDSIGNIHDNYETFIDFSIKENRKRIRHPPKHKKTKKLPNLFMLIDRDSLKS